MRDAERRCRANSRSESADVSGNPTFYVGDESPDLPPGLSQQGCEDLSIVKDLSFGRRCKTFLFREDQLRDLAEQYCTGRKELVQVCDEITDRWVVVFVLMKGL
jgi:hypothetical protein